MSIADCDNAIMAVGLSYTAETTGGVGWPTQLYTVHSLSAPLPNQETGSKTGDQLCRRGAVSVGHRLGEYVK